MANPINYVNAKYKNTGVSRYEGNPFIQALPPILSTERVGKKIKGWVKYHVSERLEKSSIRIHNIVSLLDDYFQPLGQHIQLQEKIDLMLRMGYVGRNLSDGSLNRKLQEGYERLMAGGEASANFSVEKTTARSMSLIGVSGAGKSKSLERVLDIYPQVIFHEQHNIFQIVHLKIECPSNGDLESLCLNFFRAVDSVLGTSYEQHYAKQRLSVPKMLALMQQTANNRAIGILVIDEIQRLSQVRSGGKEQMLEFFVELVNKVGIPIVLVGTPKARPIFELELQSGRRSVGLGSIYWETIPQYVKKDIIEFVNPNWLRFTDDLWKYQWLRHGDDPLTDEIRECWYDLSQGVLDIVIKLFVLAQLRAIANKKERITKSILQSVYKQELKPVHPMLEALRSGDADRITKYSDLCISDIEKRVIQLSSHIIENLQSQDEKRFEGNPTALRLFNMMLQIEPGWKEEKLESLVKNVVAEYPGLGFSELIQLLIEWNRVGGATPQKPAIVKKITKVPRRDWIQLGVDDLRYQYAYCEEENLSLVERLEQMGEMFDLDGWASGY
ncbi:AAA family ATPase [Reinekea sp. G2M2-21]|uniref:AAA family ATPase n=1 Tax=Reinekea sp. G2M2-21 TaxID=2788942 RepID=UPI0018AB921F|nr:AAA family ATPase [Reinekea sp. G2M2-21]